MQHVESGDGSIDSVTTAAAGVGGVVRVLSVHVGSERGAALVGVRIAVAPSSSTRQIAQLLERVRSAINRVVPGALVFVEPDVAAEQALPTEAIVIRALD